MRPIPWRLTCLPDRFPSQAKQKYHKACRDLENSTLQLKALEDPSNLNAKPKEVTKVRQQNATDRQNAEQAHEAYKQQIKEFNQTQKKYEEGMRHVLEQFQDLEAKRIQKVKEVSLEFHRTQDTITTSFKDHLPPLKDGIAAINDTTDLQEFIGANNTNEKPEALAAYEPFVSDKGIDVPADRSFAPGGEGSSSAATRAQSQRFAPAAVKAAVETKQEAPPALTPPPADDKGAGATPAAAAATSSSTSTDEKAGKKGGKHKDKPEEGSKSPRLKTSKSSKKLKDADDKKGADGDKGAGADKPADDKKSPRAADKAAVKTGDAPAGASAPAGEHKKARALFDYDAADETEISFKTDDVITVLPSENPMEGWLEGEFNGAKGLFPENYVEIIGEEKKPDAAAPAAEKKADGFTRRCVALYDFTAENDDELTIKEGEELDVEEESDGWCTGRNKEGKTGLFPANYVEDKK